MTKLGFTYFNDKPIVPVSTTSEMVALLTNEQKVLILDGFTKGILPQRLKYQTTVPKAIIVHLYGKIAEIEEKSRLLMRGEVVITPTEVNVKTGEETDAVYNKPPLIFAGLTDQIKVDFAEDFTETQIITILGKMVKYSKHNGIGTWTYYKTQIKL